MVKSKFDKWLNYTPIEETRQEIATQKQTVTKEIRKTETQMALRHSGMAGLRRRKIARVPLERIQQQEARFETEVAKYKPSEAKPVYKEKVLAEAKAKVQKEIAKYESRMKSKEVRKDFDEKYEEYKDKYQYWKSYLQKLEKGAGITAYYTGQAEAKIEAKISRKEARQRYKEQLKRRGITKEGTVIMWGGRAIPEAEFKEKALWYKTEQDLPKGTIVIKEGELLKKISKGTYQVQPIIGKEPTLPGAPKIPDPWKQLKEKPSKWESYTGLLPKEAGIPEEKLLEPVVTDFPVQAVVSTLGMTTMLLPSEEKERLGIKEDEEKWKFEPSEEGRKLIEAGIGLPTKTELIYEKIKKTTVAKSIIETVGGFWGAVSLAAEKVTGEPTWKKIKEDTKYVPIVHGEEKKEIVAYRPVEPPEAPYWEAKAKAQNIARAEARKAQVKYQKILNTDVKRMQERMQETGDISMAKLEAYAKQRQTELTKQMQQELESTLKPRFKDLAHKAKIESIKATRTWHKELAVASLAPTILIGAAYGTVTALAPPVGWSIAGLSVVGGALQARKIGVSWKLAPEAMAIRTGAFLGGAWLAGGIVGGVKGAIVKAKYIKLAERSPLKVVGKLHVKGKEMYFIGVGKKVIGKQKIYVRMKQPFLKTKFGYQTIKGGKLIMYRYAKPNIVQKMLGIKTIRKGIGADIKSIGFFKKAAKAYRVKTVKGITTKVELKGQVLTGKIKITPKVSIKIVKTTKTLDITTKPIKIKPYTTRAIAIGTKVKGYEYLYGSLGIKAEKLLLGIGKIKIKGWKYPSRTIFSRKYHPAGEPGEFIELILKPMKTKPPAEKILVPMIKPYKIPKPVEPPKIPKIKPAPIEKLPKGRVLTFEEMVPTPAEEIIIGPRLGLVTTTIGEFITKVTEPSIIGAAIMGAAKSTFAAVPTVSAATRQRIEAIQRPELRYLIMPALKVRVEQIPLEAYGVGLRPRAKLIQPQIQPQPPVQVQPQIPIQIPQFPMLPLVPLLLLPPEAKEKRLKRLEKIYKAKGWIAEIKKGKIWRKVTPKPVLKHKAIKIGERIALSTLVATFRIRPTKKMIKGVERVYRPREDLFRTYKIVKGRRVPLEYTWIQRKAKRLGRRSEVLQVHAARRQYLATRKTKLNRRKRKKWL